MPRGLVFRLIDGTLFYMETDLCYYSVCNTLTVGVHISSTPSISGPGSATDRTSFGVFKLKRWLHRLVAFYSGSLHSIQARCILFM